MTTGEVIALIKALGGSGGGGSGGGVLVVTNTNGTLDKTWQEIHDAFVSGGCLIDKEGKYQNAAIGVGNNKGEFYVTFASQPNWSAGTFVANAADGYPRQGGSND